MSRRVLLKHKEDATDNIRYDFFVRAIWIKVHTVLKNGIKNTNT